MFERNEHKIRRKTKKHGMKIRWCLTACGMMPAPSIRFTKYFPVWLKFKDKTESLTSMFKCCWPEC